MFECRVDERELGELQERLRQAFDAEENGSIRFYPLCADCLEKASGFGRLRITAAASRVAITD